MAGVDQKREETLDILREGKRLRDILAFYSHASSGKYFQSESRNGTSRLPNLMNNSFMAKSGTHRNLTSAMKSENRKGDGCGFKFPEFIIYQI